MIGSQKRAGQRSHYKVIVFIRMQVFFNKCRCFQFQMRADALNIGLLERRRNCLATVGTAQTIYFLDGFRVEFLHSLVHPGSFFFRNYA